MSALHDHVLSHLLIILVIFTDYGLCLFQYPQPKYCLCDKGEKGPAGNPVRGHITLHLKQPHAEPYLVTRV